MSIEEKKTFAMSWDIVGAYIAEQLTAILDTPIKCTASSDAFDYWTVSLRGRRLSLDELDHIFDEVGADEEMKQDTLGDKENSFGNIGMLLSSRLLELYTGYNWEEYLIYKNALWLIGCESNDCIRVAGRSISLGKLKSKDELMHYLNEKGSTHTSLMDFCEEYREKYHNELCWQYPISDGKHLGTYLVLVREGILSLPYDEAVKEDYEVFALEDACLFRKASDMSDFISNWDNFSNDLRNTMLAMFHYLKGLGDGQNV